MEIEGKWTSFHGKFKGNGNFHFPFGKLWEMCPFPRDFSNKKCGEISSFFAVLPRCIGFFNRIPIESLMIRNWKAMHLSEMFSEAIFSVIVIPVHISLAIEIKFFSESNNCIEPKFRWQVNHGLGLNVELSFPFRPLTSIFKLFGPKWWVILPNQMFTSKLAFDWYKLVFPRPAKCVNSFCDSLRR